MSRRKNTEAEEVEELLRVAEDDLLLKLSVNSHLKSDQAIDSDLDTRFQSLKSRSSKPKPKPKPKPNPNPNQSSSSSSVVLPIPPPPPAATGDFDGDNENPNFDDLLARFAALKGTLPSNSSSTATSTVNNQQLKSGEDDEDEVDKVIRWAIDAARLDPSPCSDDDDDEECDSHSDDDDTDDDDDFRDVKHKGRKN